MRDPRFAELDRLIALEPPSPPEPAASQSAICPHCSGSGFVGRIWTTWPEARMLFRAGVPFCNCEAGQENEREMRAEIPAVARLPEGH